MSNAATRKRNVTIEPGYFEFRNLRQRLAASAVLDFSGSMAKYAPQLPDAWKQLVEFLNKRAQERLAVELACCPFSTNVVFHDFAPTTYYMGKKLTFEEMGFTSLGTALRTVIEHTRQRRQMLAAEGIDSLQAVCVVITDGGATDRPVLEKAIKEMQVCEQEGEIEFVPVTPSEEYCDLLLSIFGLLVFFARPEVYANFRWLLLLAILTAAYFGAGVVIDRGGLPPECSGRVRQVSQQRWDTLRRSVTRGQRQPSRTI